MIVPLRRRALGVASQWVCTTHSVEATLSYASADKLHITRANAFGHCTILLFLDLLLPSFHLHD